MRATLWQQTGEISEIMREVLRGLFTLAGIDFDVVDTGEALLAAASQARRATDRDIIVIDCSSGVSGDMQRCIPIIRGTQLVVHIVHPREQAVRDLEAVAGRQVVWFSTTSTPIDLQDKLQLLRTIATEPTEMWERPILTEREREVTALLIDGRTNAEIADQLHMAKDTAKKHVHAVLQKFEVNSRRALRQKCEGRGRVGEDLVKDARSS